MNKLIHTPKCAGDRGCREEKRRTDSELGPFVPAFCHGSVSACLGKFRKEASNQLEIHTLRN